MIKIDDSFLKRITQEFLKLIHSGREKGNLDRKFTFEVDGFLFRVSIEGKEKTTLKLVDDKD